MQRQPPDEPLKKHILVELPRNPNFVHPLVLLDVFSDGQRVIRRVFPLQSPTSFFGLLEDVGLEATCIHENSISCKVQVAGDLWEPSHRNHHVFSGAYVVVKTFSFDQCEESHSVTDDSLLSLGFSLMQEDIQLSSERRASDQVYRILADKGHLWTIDWNRGAAISLWGAEPDFARSTSSAETRAFLDEKNDDWTQSCLVNFLGQRSSAPFLFEIAQPSPPMRRLVAHNLNLCMILQSTRISGHRTLLADLWQGNFVTRRFVQFHEDDFLIEIARQILKIPVEERFLELFWQGGDGLIRLGPFDKISLPDCALVEIRMEFFRNDQCDGTSLVQTSMSSARGSSSAFSNFREAALASYQEENDVTAGESSEAAISFVDELFVHDILCNSFHVIKLCGFILMALIRNFLVNEFLIWTRFRSSAFMRCHRRLLIFESIFLDGRTCHVLPQGGSIGRDEQGHWRTSKLKACCFSC